jgi:hypothetical protein
MLLEYVITSMTRRCAKGSKHGRAERLELVWRDTSEDAEMLSWYPSNIVRSLGDSLGNEGHRGALTSMVTGTYTKCDSVMQTTGKQMSKTFTNNFNDESK